jgi:hypothetical protein
VEARFASSNPQITQISQIKKQESKCVRRPGLASVSFSVELPEF